MSTLLGKEHNTVLRSEKDLTGYFLGFAKKPDQLRIGLEAEFLGVDVKTGQALPYEGSSGIEKVFKTLATPEFGYEPVLDHGRMIALTKNQTVIGLEPGGQIELSAPPVFTVSDVEQHLQNFITELHQIQKKIPNVCWIASGIHPFSRLDEISWVPKHRYQILADYLKSRGNLSHSMMKFTATNQFNFDYTDEKDAMEKLRLMFLISPVVSAMFANGSFSEGKSNGFASYRLEIWNHTAPERSGLLTEFLKPHQSFESYLEYILKMPMIFIVRQNEWIPMKGLTFRNYIREGYQGIQATIGDFELHMSTAFPDARLKQYLEVRSMDCQSPDLIPSMAAFWKGLLYNAKARAQVFDLMGFASPEDLLQLRLQVPKFGLETKLAGKPVLELARHLADLAKKALAREPQSKDEANFLKPLEEKILIPGKCPGKILIEKWQTQFRQDPAKIIDFLKI